MSKAKTIALKGLSRTPYDFEIHSWDTAFSAQSAVYAVLKQVAHGYCVIYVSHTCDLKDCFAEHELKAHLDRAGGTHIGIRIETTPSSRMSIKADLVASYTPVCNIDAPSIEEEQMTYQMAIKQTVIGKIAGVMGARRTIN